MTAAPDDDAEARFWQALERFDFGSVEASLREQAARAWSRAALAEHASVASFNRFSLELLAVGAPPEFVADAQCAALDEIQHARLSFALSSGYAGEPRGPGPLALPRELRIASQLDEVVSETVAAGCVGETLAALEAEMAAALAVPEPARIALGLIAADEARHAELAWAFVAWALTIGGPELRGAARAAFEGALEAALNGVLDGALDASLERHGHLSGERRRELRVRSARDTLRPAGEALFASGAPR